MITKDLSNTIQAVDTNLAIVEALYESDGARVTELANELGTPPSTVYSHLATLRENQFVVKEGDEYHLGLKFAKLGLYSKTRKREFETARKAVEDLGKRTKYDTDFITVENGKGVYLKTASESASGGVYPMVGDREYLHCIAAGKAILAELDADRVAKILDHHGLPEITSETITDREVLEKELEEIEHRGYAFNRGESSEGLRAVATAVTDPQGIVLGGISLSGPAYRLNTDWFKQEAPKLVQEAAETIQRKGRDP